MGHLHRCGGAAKACIAFASAANAVCSSARAATLQHLWPQCCPLAFAAAFRVRAIPLNCRFVRALRALLPARRVAAGSTAFARGGSCKGVQTVEAAPADRSLMRGTFPLALSEPLPVSLAR
eukprot:6199559-Pleurochrysis_carterae.AAC.4